MAATPLARPSACAIPAQPQCSSSNRIGANRPAGSSPMRPRSCSSYRLAARAARSTSHGKLPSRSCGAATGRTSSRANEWQWARHSSCREVSSNSTCAGNVPDLVSATTPTPKTVRALGTLADLVHEASARKGVAMRYADASGEWVDLTYEQLGETVLALARGLIALGIEPGDRVAIMSRTRPE